jgi:MFS family permease
VTGTNIKNSSPIMAQPSAWSRILNTLQFRRDYNHLPAGIRWRSNTFFIVSTIGVGMFTDLFLYGLIVPILPFMLRDRIGVPEKQIQSYVSMLLAVFAGASVLCSPFVGYLSDRLSSRQSMFVFGLLLMIFATIMLFTGESIPVLVIARMLQGVSGGFVWTIGLALCLETVGPDKLGTTVGSVSTLFGP